MTKPSKTPVDWNDVENAIRDSVTGRGMTNRDQSMVAAAYNEDRVRYIDLHLRVKKHEQSLLNPMAKKNDP